MYQYNEATRKIINYDYITKEDIGEKNPIWRQISHHSYRIIKSCRNNALVNLIKQQNDDDYNIIDKIYLYVKDPNETK